MSDKSFGDHINKNIVKNPLLSTAVVGLSLDDLTHNAVLLPVVQNSGLISSQDPQNAAQTVMQANTNLPSGDAKPPQPPHRAVSTPSLEPNKKTENILKSKTHDDFDVNEYIARLQGTKYVSAPINASLDQKSNLEAAEDNLEEINLNDSTNEEVQQSITADIAQNFSQLPTVLPQVASAVFSSFSNMLSYRSREQTPEVVKAADSGYEEVQFQGSDDAQAQAFETGVGVRREVGPPPREPPVGCNANTFRITTKKKAYAQIPGLSCGEAGSQNATSSATHNIPSILQANTPTYFVPGFPGSQTLDNQQLAKTTEVLYAPSISPLASSFGTAASVAASESKTSRPSQNASVLTPPPSSQSETYNISSVQEVAQINPPLTTEAETVQTLPFSVESNIQSPENFSVNSSMALSRTAPPTYSYGQGYSVSKNPSTNPPMIPPSSSNMPTFNATLSQGPNTSIIPPPTMFSNHRRDSKTDTVEKTVLPPSVARRLSANQPGTKPHTATPTFGANIFVPTPNSSENASESAIQNVIPPIQSNISPFDPSALQSKVSNAPTPMFFNPASLAASVESTKAPENSTIQNIPHGRDDVVLAPMFFNPASTGTVIEPPKPVTTTTQRNIQASSLPSPMFFNPASSASDIEPLPFKGGPAATIDQVTLQASNVPPPLFLYPNTSIPPNVSPKAADSIEKPPTMFSNLPRKHSTSYDQMAKMTATTAQSNIEPPKQLFDPISIITPIVEPPKPVPEPPKMVSGNVNFRMSKKRPQYYSGPIEGVGAISNKVKPIIASMDVPASSFKGALFTPESMAQPVKPTAETQSYVPPSVPIDQASLPFDISRPAEATIPQANYGYDLTQHQIYPQQQCNTAFDFSRQDTNDYEPPKEETKGFGLIGSLKSKLSSLDINKIQNSVTTFFDPAYNVSAKTDTSNYQERTTDSNISYDQGHGNQSTGFEIFVPNVDANIHQPYAQSDDTSFQNQNAQYNIYGVSSQYCQSPEQFSYYQTLNAPYNQVISNNQTIQPTIPSWIHQFGQSQDKQARQSVIGTPAAQMDQNTLVEYNFTCSAEKQLPEQNTYQVKNVSLTTNFIDDPQERRQVYDPNQLSKSNVAAQNTPKQDSFKQSVDISICSSKVETKVEENIPSQFLLEKDSVSVSETITHPTADAAPSIELKQNESLNNEENKQILTVFQQTTSPVQHFPTADIFKAPLLELSTMLANNHNEMTNLESKIVDKTIKEKSEVLKTLERSSASFFDDIGCSGNNKTGTEIEESDNLESGDLNICETCREVSQPEEEVKDFTSQLIDNITSPIQLSNPVEVPLAESHVPLDSWNFDSNQCAEITHITAETMETIQVQSATELLEEKDIKQYDKNLNYNIDHPDVNNYGWCTTDLSTQEPSSIQLDHIYSFQPDPSAIGFFSNNSLFFDNIPNNASDEIKAEFKNAKEDSPTNILSRQMSIPSAPPAEDLEDNKSDETGGLDVQLIEQDAKKDFPIFEEFVIEPSETDDDKIEVIEREKSEDPNQNEDDFANRLVQLNDIQDLIDSDNVANIECKSKNQVFELPTSTSPAMTIASYFDTGNYAADTHYRKSLTSPTSINTFCVGSPNQNKPVLPTLGHPSLIPQSFKTDVLTRPSYGNFNAPFQPDKISPDQIPVPEVPDTSTQTRPIATVTYGNAGDIMKAEEIAISATLPGVDISELLQNSMLLEDATNVNISGFSSVFQKQRLIEQEASQASSELEKALNVKPESSNAFQQQKLGQTSPPPDTQASKTLATPSFSGNKLPVLPIQAASLPDPINFFSSPVNTKNPEASNINTDSSINRLASYFASPATATDNSKSFFELSQGQDHLRKEIQKDQQQAWENTQSYKSFFDVNDQIQDPAKHEPKVHKTFYELLHNHEAGDSPNTPQFSQQQFKANEDLMKDLTSCNYYNPDKEQTVKTVNYCTVEYNNFSLQIPRSGVNIPKPFNIDNRAIKTRTSKEDLKQNNQKLELNEELEETKINDIKFNEIVDNCKYCGNLGSLQRVEEKVDIFNQKVMLRKAMDSNSTQKSEINTSVAESDEMAGKSANVSFDIPFEDSNDEQIAILTDSRTQTEYTPVKHHWFYRVDYEGKSTWRGFSKADSRALEEAFSSSDLNENTLVATDGGRYDVNVLGRLRIAVYWSDKPTNVRRCSWFYKGTTDARYVPYSEAVADKLEEEYRHGVTTGEWHRRLALPNNEVVVMHGPAVMVHFLQSSSADAWSGGTLPRLFAVSYKKVYRNPRIGVPKDEVMKIDHLLFMVHGAGEWEKQKSKIQSTMRPRVVRRGHDEAEIEDEEPNKIDHLLLLCHGVGSACDMRFRAVEEVVDDFRATSLQLIQSHYRNSYDNGVVGRVEVLPVSWHATLHSGEGGVDKRLARITLESIPRLRTFTNDTVLDVLFYTSPVFCQTIVDTVCAEMNRIYSLFKLRNPGFDGGVSLGGHSLGSVILYDLLCHQVFEDSPEVHQQTAKVFVNGTHSGQPAVKYPKLQFEPTALYGLGSPIAMFECIRGVELLGEQFKLPTCDKLFNIFHPYDPIAYRIEPMINPKLKDVPPFLIPHHKGRKRMHLELKETVARVGADLKQKLVESIKATWSSMWRSQPPPHETLEKVVEEEIEKGSLDDDTKEQVPVDIDPNTEQMLGKLNGGSRIDYVLQEAPFEMINEYLFAMTSHVCYWESEDTMLLILREIYDGIGVQPDSTVPQQTMTVQRTKIVSNKDDAAVSTPTMSDRASTSGV